MATHYETLGVRSSATPEQVRRAYRDRARELHPDGHAGGPEAALDDARRAMQDLNEAWRVLRDPDRRAAYDRWLQAATTPPVPEAAPAGASEWLDRPYQRPPAQPGDLTVLFVRAAPWVAVLVVLAAVLVFTAVAGGDDGRDELVSRCVTVTGGLPEPVPCDEPNIGRVVAVVREQSRCTSGTSTRVVAGGDWLCLRPAASP